MATLPTEFAATAGRDTSTPKSTTSRTIGRSRGSSIRHGAQSANNATATMVTAIAGQNAFLPGRGRKEAADLGSSISSQASPISRSRFFGSFPDTSSVKLPRGADREIQWFAGNPAEYISLGLQAANRNLHGQRRESHRLYLRAAETARRRGLGDVADEFEEADARVGALLGD